MKKKVTFVIITPKNGRQMRFSVHRSLLYGLLMLVLALLGSGVVGAWKYRENAVLEKQCQLLEAEKAQLEAVSRTVDDIKRDEVAIRKLLGLEGAQDQQPRP